MSARCPCSRAPALPGRFCCASCEARRTPVALPPLEPVDHAGFVLAPPVAPSPPRRMAPPTAYVEPSKRPYVQRRATPEEREPAVAAVATLVAHYGSRTRAALGAGLSASALRNILIGHCGPSLCARIVEIAARLPRAA